MTDLNTVDLRETYTWLYKIKEAAVSNQIPAIKDFTTPEQWLSILKMAASPDKDFEQSFFQLAYDKLQEKLYNLLPFLIGFEIVNKVHDGTKAIGVFAFKSNNNQIIYVPAFFIDGNVKGLDMLYSKNNEQFYPLNEDFAELFLKDDVTGIGDTSHERKDQINKDMAPVDLRNLVTPPRTGKISYASVIDFVKESDNMVKKAFTQLLETNVDFCETVLRYYDMDKVAEAITPLVEKVEHGPVRIVTLENKVAGLTEVEKEKLLTDGVLLIDKRASCEKSKVGLFHFTQRFKNPTKSGFYTYITENGSLRYGLVIVRPTRLQSFFASNMSIVIDLDAKNKGQAYIVDTSNLFVKDCFEIDDFTEVHKNFQELSEAEPSFNDTYILINDKLQATQPFRVLSNTKDEEGIRRVRVELDYRVSHCKEENYCIGKQRKSACNTFTLVPTKSQGRLDLRGDILYVPTSYKLFKIRTSSYVSSDYTSTMTAEEYQKAREADKKEEERIRLGKPGGIGALHGALAECGVYPFNLNSNGSEYFVNIASAKKKYRNAMLAKMGMVVHFGLDEKDAENLINSVKPGIKKEGYIKLAYTGEYVHYLRDENPYTNELGQPTYTGQGYEEVQTPTDGYQDDPTKLGKGVMPDIEGLQDAINQATQLAQAGQKGIFDTQAIATLSKYVSPGGKISQYMPSYVKAMDELGRLLFMCYWETEKFEEMYGRSEVPELVELVNNVFTNLGDLVIFLKRKSPELSINMVKEELSV